MSNDNLTIALFLLSTAITLAATGMSAAGWRHPAFVRGLFALAIIVGLVGLGWPLLRSASPIVTAIVSQIATSPVSWFVVLMAALTVTILPAAKSPRLMQLGGNGLKSEASTDTNDLAVVSDTLVKLADDMGKVNKKVEALEKNNYANNTKVRSLARYLPLIMDHMTEHLALSILFDAVPEIPFFSSNFSTLTDTSMKNEQETYDKYCDEVRRILGNTQWAFDIRSILQSSDGMGEHRLRQLSQAERPKVDTLDLRRYLIAKTKAESIQNFIWAQRNEAKDKYLAYLHFWKERASELKLLENNQ